MNILIEQNRTVLPSFLYSKKFLPSESDSCPHVGLLPAHVIFSDVHASSSTFPKSKQAKATAHKKTTKQKETTYQPTSNQQYSSTMAMIIGTTLRQGRHLALKCSPIIGVRNGSSSVAAISRCADSLTSEVVSEHRRQARSYSSASNNLLTTCNGRSSLSYYHQPPIQLLHHNASYHTSTPSLQAEVSKADLADKTLYEALSPSVRDAIITDLRSVDADNNGRIDAEELKVLLRKHNTSFSESEILELSELFYTSLGASAVDINRFLEALDAAASDRSTSGGGETENGEVSPLAMKGKFKTHPLGIGTCASEYM